MQILDGYRWGFAGLLYRGELGYRPRLDGDNDGIACEPYRGR
ncbi:excalibur calcium-binding domain-containing protein [Pseudoblastomonas halimionae]|uniref:Calcium-binding protein n=1 Tax=Alteriqipengyuania halimionae TaxID=1926630 RepID=A0A6I4U8I4_9SPHN|nr:excalibur calcium-binding domain-containing protein [Alteriqipengyuania halimionae]MXP11115.1 calcium-binding protein [Alteriqipengyuania halimionae]